MGVKSQNSVIGDLILRQPWRGGCNSASSLTKFSFQEGALNFVKTQHAIKAQNEFNSNLKVQATN